MVQRKLLLEPIMENPQHLRHQGLTKVATPAITRLMKGWNLKMWMTTAFRDAQDCISLEKYMAVIIELGSYAGQEVKVGD